MKYKTTKKHPELKEGVEIFKRFPEYEEYMSESDTFLMLIDDIKICLEKGWIAEPVKVELSDLKELVKDFLEKTKELL